MEKTLSPAPADLDRPYPLSDLQRAFFRENGFIKLKGVFAAETLARFGPVYYSHFKCNLRRLTDYPALWAYARDLYARPAFRNSTKFDQIKRHYYMTHPQLNPTRIVPDGPLLDWDEPAGRDG